MKYFSKTIDSTKVYDEFFSEYSSLIVRVISKSLKKYNVRFDSCLLDEIYQNVALKIIKNDYLAKYDSSKSKLSSWIYVIVESSVVDELRKQNKQQTETLDEAFSIGVRTYFSSVSNYIPKELLTERQREIILLTIEREYSTKETSKLLSISESSVRCLKHQALRRLRNYYTTHHNCGEKYGYQLC